MRAERSPEEIAKDVVKPTLTWAKAFDYPENELRARMEHAVAAALQAEREKREAAEAHRDEVRAMLSDEQQRFGKLLNDYRGMRSKHTTTREALRELVEAVARLQQATTETTVNAGYIWQDRYRDLIQTLTRARALA